MSRARRSRSVQSNVKLALAWLERRGTKRNREGMARYAIRAPKVFGVSIATMQSRPKRLGHDHDLAEALWETGWYEARILASFVDEPARVTAAQMDRWCRDFDNWAVCDTVCFHLFDRAPGAWRAVARWQNRRPEFVRRAAFALIASLALHDKTAGDAPFLEALHFIEDAADDDRNFVKKAVNWALRSVAARTTALNAEAIRVATRLSQSPQTSTRWIGNDSMRALT